jgi:two-component system phosphate regulon response regulator PhoB
VVGFEIGADDYVTKPFSVRELVLRLKALVRRTGSGRTAERPPEQVGPIRVDVDAHRAFVDGAEVALTPLEFRLLSTLMARLGRVQSREQLLEDVWEMSSEVETRTVDTHVKRLREKLGSGRDLLETVRGIGYRLVDPGEKA